MYEEKKKQVYFHEADRWTFYKISMQILYFVNILITLYMKHQRPGIHIRLIRVVLIDIYIPRTPEKNIAHSLFIPVGDEIQY